MAIRVTGHSVRTGRAKLTRFAKLNLAVAPLLMLIASTTQAVEPTPEARVRLFPPDPDGNLVTNQTISLVGRDFYEYFVRAWSEMPMVERYALAIHEWPSPRWGSKLWIEYSNQVVFQIFVQPARTRIKGVADEAAAIAYRNAVDTEVRRMFFRDPDLGRDEL